MESFVDGNKIINQRFFSAGKAIFTIYSPDKHYTYKIQQKKAEGDEKQKNMPYFAYLLTGSDNTNSYTYMGLYNPCYNELRLTKASKYNHESEPVKVLRWGFRMIAEGNWNNPKVKGYGIKSESRCCKCGRKLTTPESIEYGIGPECMNRM